jgi:hypothetical protein
MEVVLLDFIGIFSWHLAWILEENLFPKKTDYIIHNLNIELVKLIFLSNLL